MSIKKSLIIFLDIDGVLNTSNTARTQINLIDTNLTERFNKFLDGKDVDIIISSSWRHDMKELEKCLKKANFRHWGKVKGKTPSYSHLTKRGEQIARWLQDNDVNSIVDDYVIIDDEIEDIVPFVNKHMVFKTDITKGITQAQLNKLDKMYVNYYLINVWSGHLYTCGTEEHCREYAYKNIHSKDLECGIECMTGFMMMKQGYAI